MGEQIFESYYDDTQEIARALLASIAENERDLFDIDEIERAIYHIRCDAQNEYNFDYFRQLYNLLVKINEWSYVPF